MITRAGFYCAYCRKRKLATWQYPNISLHSSLLIVTCGLWLPVWVYVMLCGGRWVCRECGSDVY